MSETCATCGGHLVEDHCPDPAHHPARDAALRGLVEAARGLMLAVVHDVGPVPYESDIRKVLDALRAAESAMGGERHG